MFGATSIMKNSRKDEYVYSGYGIAFDEKGEFSFDNETPRNVVIFDLDISLSSQADYFKSNFLVLGEGDTFVINESFGAPAKKLIINFSTANTKFA